MSGGLVRLPWTRVISMDLFVTFQEPFWVAIVLVADDARTLVHRHVFGPSEPTEPDVHLFVRHRLSPLLEEAPSAVLPRRDDRLPTTRAARLRLARDLVERPLIDEELSAALGAGRAERRRTRAALARAEAEVAKAHARELAREKQREHHRHG
jgi:hypothetical protein